MPLLLLSSAAAVAGAAAVALLKRRRSDATAQPSLTDIDSARWMNVESDVVWLQVRMEAAKVLMSEPALRRRLRNAILRQSDLESALAHILGNTLSSWNHPRRQLHRLFRDVLASPESVEAGGTLSSHIRADLIAVKERDEACHGTLQVLMFFKGYLAIQAHRVAHVLWHHDRKWMAMQIQASVSQRLGVDIHPAATIGRRVMIDHATGVVIGETAYVGDDSSLLHNVTLGASGKDGHDRHPKLGSGVLVGAGALVIGNISIGDNAKIGGGSVVLKDIPTGATAVGNPARIIGRSKEQVPGKCMDCGLKGVEHSRQNGSTFDLFALNTPKEPGKVSNWCLHKALEDILPGRDIDRLFFELDAEHTGQVKIEDVKQSLVAAVLKCSNSYNKDHYCAASGTEAFAWKETNPAVLLRKITEAVERGQRCPQAAGV